MKIVLCSVLALVQVLICTVGQGALTLCVRTNGTQRLQWTSSSSCKKEKTSKCSCGCNQEKPCEDEETSDSEDAKFDVHHCKSCTDYHVMAAQPSVTIEKHQETFLSESFQIEFSFVLISHLPSVSSHFQIFDSQSCLQNGIATILSSVVIRC